MEDRKDGRDEHEQMSILIEYESSANTVRSLHIQDHSLPRVLSGACVHSFVIWQVMSSEVEDAVTRAFSTSQTPNL